MSNFNFFVLAMATWRIANMLVAEDGPWMVFERLRLKAGLQPPPLPDGIRETDPPGRMPGSLFACTWCMSIYVATFWAGLFMLRPKIAQKIALPFALSAISCVVDNWGNQ